MVTGHPPEVKSSTAEQNIDEYILSIPVPDLCLGTKHGWKFGNVRCISILALRAFDGKTIQGP